MQVREKLWGKSWRTSQLGSVATNHNRTSTPRTHPKPATLAQRWHGRVLMVDVDDASEEVFVECLKPGGALERSEESRGAWATSARSAWLQHAAADEPGQATMFDRSGCVHQTGARSRRIRARSQAGPPHRRRSSYLARPPQLARRKLRRPTGPKAQRMAATHSTRIACSR